ncbi:MAG: sulfite exporter TauE/SafE family protein [Candidatus Promineofilum sp.]|nr:sulfite exporter TauE/SafE family protein [Promineifilum sp.]MCW5863664.1 sulfite exporter TauE/SafE family protein [Anaerolineae bacterium]
MQLEPLQYVLVTLAAVAAGAINALAGGGTLITFPTLTAMGIPAVSANVTNTVALLPGYLGATFAQKEEVLSQRRRLWLLLPAALGGLVGGLLLLRTDEKLFRQLVPFLILLASLLLAAQEPLKRWLAGKRGSRGAPEGTPAPRSPAFSGEAWAAVPVFFAAIYGGYFGAGLSVIVLAVLALVIDDSLTRLNGLKQVVGFVTNLTAALFFVFSGRVIWPVAAVMAVGALIGGALGGRLAGRVAPATLRRVVVVIGIAVAIIYFVRG